MAMLTGMGQLAVGLYVPSMPAIADHFAADDDRVRLTFSLFILTLAVAQLIVGPLSDRFGRKVVLQVGNLIFLASSALCAFAPTLGVLIAARVAQGVGACVPVVVSRAVVRDGHSGEEAARALAAIGIVMAIAPAIGPTLGGFIQVTLGWRAVFGVLTIVGVIAFLLIQFQLVETLPRERRQPLRLTRILSTYLSLLADRRFMAYALAVSFSMAGLGAYLAGAPFIFIRLLDVSEPVFGMFSIINVGSFAIGSAIATRVTGRWLTMPAMVLLGGCLTTASGCTLLVMMLSGHLSVLAIMGSVAPYFVGMGLLAPNAMAAAINRYPDKAGLASAMLGFLQFGGWGGAGLAVGLLGGSGAVPFSAVVAFVGTATLVSFLILYGKPGKFRP
jgi:DHA1 family bicyclomycin/chloramphenicol resistance-like MFS transporter